MKVIILSAQDVKELPQYFEEFFPLTELVYAGEEGSVTPAILFAKDNNIPITYFPIADRDNDREFIDQPFYSARIRNFEMCRYAEAALLYWKQFDRNILDIINKMKALDKPNVQVDTDAERLRIDASCC